MTAQATSPFLLTSAAVLLGLGAPIANIYDVTALAATGNVVITFVTPVTKGQIRSKSSAVNGATTALRGAVTGTDGTNTVRLQPAWSAATAAGQNFDEIYDFCSDLQLTSITIPFTLGGGTTVATINTEVFANP
jgi:hypothetical protein